MQKQNYSAVIFDLDGTLLNTLDDLTDSTNFALRQNGFAPRTKDEVRRFVGNGVGLLIERCLAGGKENEKYNITLETFRGHYMKNCNNKTRPYEGIAELLGSLKTKGYKIGVVSNKPDGAVKELCAAHFAGLTDAVVGESPLIKRKPAPDMLYEALKILALKAEDAIYVGDSDVDVKFAKNAGMKCISVLWGFRDRDFLEENGAETFAGSAADIEKLIR